LGPDAAFVVTHNLMTLLNLRYGVQLGCFAALLFWAGTGMAQSSDSARAHLQLSAPSSCTTAGALIQRVRLRSRHIQFVDDRAGVPVLGVTIRSAAKQPVAAELTLVWPDGRRSERRLVDASCAQAVDALALLIALALDPSLQQTAAPDAADRLGGAAAASGADANANANAAGEASGVSGAASSAAGPAAAASGAGSSASANGAGPAAEPAPAGQPTPRQPDGAANQAAAAAAEQDSLSREHFAAGLAAQLIGGAAPQWMPGFVALLSVAFGRSAPWAPSLQLEAAHAFSGTMSESGGRASFQLDTLRLDVCALGWAAGPLALRGCIAGALGRLAARGEDTYSPASTARLWASLAALVLMSVDMGSHLEIQSSAALYAPLRRDAYAFAPDVFYRAAVLGLDLRLGIGVRFP
jgi:hypothetical protein